MQAKQKNRLEQFAHLTQIATGISVVLGIIIALYGLYDTKRQAELSLKALRFSSLEQINAFIDQDTQVREKIGKFLIAYNKDTSNSASASLNKYKTGKAAYLSNDLRLFREIGRHYERIGIMIKLEYIDFRLIYEVIPFPDEFWESTENLRKVIGNNWRGKGDALNDFWKNFSWLQKKYAQQRTKDE